MMTSGTMTHTTTSILMCGLHPSTFVFTPAPTTSQKYTVMIGSRDGYCCGNSVVHSSGVYYGYLAVIIQMVVTPKLPVIDLTYCAQGANKPPYTTS